MNEPNDFRIEQDLIADDIAAEEAFFAHECDLEIEAEESAHLRSLPSVEDSATE